MKNIDLIGTAIWFSLTLALTAFWVVVYMLISDAFPMLFPTIDVL